MAKRAYIQQVLEKQRENNAIGNILMELELEVADLKRQLEVDRDILRIIGGAESKEEFHQLWLAEMAQNHEKQAILEITNRIKSTAARF